MRMGIASYVLAAGTLMTCCGALASTFPDRPITMVVPFSPGGPTDTVARVTAEAMSRALGQQVVVQNVPGAGGTIGSTQVVRSRADGHTMLLHHVGLATAVTLYRKLPFDPQGDLAPVGMVSNAAMAVIARDDFEPDDFRELVDAVREQGDEISFGNAGLGSSSHLCGMMFMDKTDSQLMAVPFSGGGPVIQALVGKHIDMGCEQATTAIPLIQSKRAKVYAVTSHQRLPALPDVPTTAEAGLDGLEVGVWHGLFVPRDTPADAVEKLSAALGTALREPGLHKRFADISTDATPEESTPAALANMLDSEINRWRPLIQAAGQYAD